MNTGVRTMRASRNSSKSSNATKSPSASVAKPTASARSRQSSIENHIRASAVDNPPHLLKSLNNQAREEALSGCIIRRYAKGENIIREGERVDGMYFIDRGRAQVTMSSACGGEVNFTDLEQGEHFGAFSIINGEALSVTITALADTRIFVMPPAVFRRMLSRHMELVYGLMERLNAHARQLRSRILEYSTVSVDRRVRAELLRMSGRHFMLDGVSRIPHMTHAKFAGHVSCHREAVSRELKALERDNIVTKNKRQFIISDIARLRKMQEDDSK